MQGVDGALLAGWVAPFKGGQVATTQRCTLRALPASFTKAWIDVII
jgi:hypothetical protein